MIPKIQLTPRLLAIADMCRGSKKIIDVGCDHAKLPIYLVQNDIVESAVATDIREGPLKNAKKNIEAYGLSEHIRTNLCFGLKDFTAGSADTVVIAGMGADEIMAILDGATWTKSPMHKIIIQPMTGAPRVREYLSNNRYAVQNEVVALEGDKVYAIIMAVWGGATIVQENYFLFSNALKNSKNAMAYIDKLCSQHSKILNGVKKSLDTEPVRQKEILEFLETTKKEMALR